MAVFQDDFDSIVDCQCEENSDDISCRHKELSKLFKKTDSVVRGLLLNPAAMNPMEEKCDCKKFAKVSTRFPVAEVSRNSEKIDSPWSPNLTADVPGASSTETPRPFHPCDPPRGMHNYDLGCLTADQKRALNRAKMTQRKENEIYLNAHPEIRALISILLRHIFQKQPTTNVHEAIGEYFKRSRERIVLEVIRYLSRSEICNSETIERLRREIAEESDSEKSVSTHLTDDTSKERREDECPGDN